MAKGTASVVAPWLWHLGWGKAFLVYALMAKPQEPLTEYEGKLAIKNTI
jgi:hypothetical protein